MTKEAKSLPGNIHQNKLPMHRHRSFPDNQQGGNRPTDIYLKTPN